MMVWGVPAEVKRFFAKPVRDCAKPIRGALAGGPPGGDTRA